VIDGRGVRLGLGVTDGLGVVLDRTVLVGFGVFVGLPCAVAGMVKAVKSSIAVNRASMKCGRILDMVFTPN